MASPSFLPHKWTSHFPKREVATQAVISAVSLVPAQIDEEDSDTAAQLIPSLKGMGLGFSFSFFQDTKKMPV